MRFPSRAVADLARWAKKHGCVYEGVASSGHVKFRLPTGERYTTGASPSDQNSVKIARREIAKKIGVRLEKPNAAHYKRETRAKPAPAVSERVDSLSAQYSRLAKKHQTLCAQIKRAQSIGDRDTAAAAVRELLDVEAGFAPIGRRPPLRTFRV